jgi:hypothetical protein
MKLINEGFFTFVQNITKLLNVAPASGDGATWLFPTYMEEELAGGITTFGKH